jgi:pimeloyl-ACP methyl ester carboxylesterase
VYEGHRLDLRSATRPTLAAVPLHYDEFAYFHENAEEFDIPFDVPPVVERVAVDVGGGQEISALRWGTGDADLVLLHGGAQNAHTWDTVALALARPLVAVDLPGHGHSSHRADHAYWPQENAVAVAAALRALAVRPRFVVGMSLGGLTTLALSAHAPDLVPEMVLVDVTPGVDHEKASAIVQFIDGPEYFESFDEILERTIRFNPTRTESSLRRGVLHNAVEQDDGRWSWRYDLPRRGDPADGGEPGMIPGLEQLWDQVSAFRGPITLARGALSPVVADEDVTELLRRRPDAQVEVVEGAGHSIQGDRPLELAAIIAARL